MTNISWATRTSNVISGCSDVTTECANCYAKRMAWRMAAHPDHTIKAKYQRTVYQTPQRKIIKWTGRVFFHPHEMDKWAKWRPGQFVFLNSMSDTFHDDVQDEWLHEMFLQMEKNSHLCFLLLTKRPENARAWSHRWMALGHTWPRNVWLGVSCGMREAIPRVAVLGEIPAPVRFVSAEPLLEPLDLREHLGPIDWLIVGSESAPKATRRSSDLAWVRWLRDQCAESTTAFWFKQWHNQKGRKTETPPLDGETWTQRPLFAM